MAQNNRSTAGLRLAVTKGTAVGQGMPEIGGLGYNCIDEARSIPLLELQEVDRLAALITEDGDREGRAAAFVFLMDSVFAHCDDEGYVSGIAARARDRAFFDTVIANNAIRTFVRKASQDFERQLKDWEK